MKKETVTVNLQGDVGERPIAMLVQVASKYEASVYLETEKSRVNAKSIMGMMSLAPDTGDKLTIACDGADEDVALAGIKMFLTGNDK